MLINDVSWQMSVKLKKLDNWPNNRIVIGLNPRDFLFPSLAFGNSWHAIDASVETSYIHNVAIGFEEKVYLHKQDRPCLPKEGTPKSQLQTLPE
jgi:hypothetical protein